ncbi:X-ray repair cross-complementing protein 5-like [Pollicipes pollicipes]|uniref:X-ray repair cross-complementing protein 5-like n=1 Tax=Pollicipes pollicipes TaxID=41117 RepID=UPI001884ABA2|nr:X-ray repair cross-complementing protein 5-like [Pollicipes pollicipes]
MEALVLVVDVGASTGVQPPDGRPSFLETALRCCDRVVQRKLFSAPKDHVALVLIGSDATDNALADGDQYQHVSLARRLAPADWQLVHLLQDELHASAAQGDWLDGLVVALDHLEASGRVHKYAERRLVLLTDFAGPLCADQLDAIAAGLRRLEVDLTVIGVELSDAAPVDAAGGGGDEPRAGPSRPPGSLRHDGKPKTQRQLDGEAVAARLIDSLDCDFHAFEQALPQLLFFRKRATRAAPWNAPLQIGDNLTIPITGYSQVRKATPPSWKKLTVDEQPEAVRQRKLYELQDDERTVVPVEDTLRAFSYGTTLVPFSADDEKRLKYSSGAPCSLQVLGFTAAANVHPYQFLGTQTVQIVARRDDAAAETALSALIHALLETDMVAITRRTYRAGLMPLLGALLPLIHHSFECLVFVQLPFCEDVRGPLFEPLPETFGDGQLAAVDQLLDAMDLTAPAARPVAERLAPGALIGTVSPVDDFVTLLGRDDVQFDELCAQMQRVIASLVREVMLRPMLLDKTLSAIVCLRQHCCRIAPLAYNTWRLGPITVSESVHPAGTDEEAEQFYRSVQAEQAAPADVDMAEDLLDDL